MLVLIARLHLSDRILVQAMGSGPVLRVHLKVLNPCRCRFLFCSPVSVIRVLGEEHCFSKLKFRSGLTRRSLTCPFTEAEAEAGLLSKSHTSTVNH